MMQSCERAYGGTIAVDGKWGTCDPKQESRARELGIRKAKKAEQLTTVVPAECILYDSPDVFISRCTSAICAETEAVGVPMGMRQKSAVHFGGVLMVWLAILSVCCVGWRKGGGGQNVHLQHHTQVETRNFGGAFYTSIFKVC
jgi:hypothetical protein